MLRIAKILASVLLLVLATVTAVPAIQKVPARLNVLEFGGGSAQAMGTYDNIAGIIFVDGDGNLLDLDLSADDAWDPGYFFSLGYSQVSNRHLLTGGEFRFARAKVDDMIEFSIEQPKINIYDLGLRLNWLFLDLASNNWTPYFGPNLHLGLVERSYRGFANENKVTYDLGFDFGAEFKIWSDPSGRGFVTLASANNWVLAASSSRPHRLHIGAAVRYFYRP